MATNKTNNGANNMRGFNEILTELMNNPALKDIPTEVKVSMAQKEFDTIVEMAKMAMEQREKNESAKTKKIEQEANKDILEVMSEKAANVGKIAAGTMYTVCKSYEPELENVTTTLGCMIENIGKDEVKTHLKKGAKSALWVGLAKLVKDNFADNIVGIDYLTDGIMFIKGAQAVYHFYCATSKILKVDEEQKKTYKERNMKIYNEKIAKYIDSYKG